MPEETSDRVVEDIPDRMPEDLPNRIPEDLPDHLPEDIPGGMPNTISEKMSDRIPDVFLPIRKYTIVIMGFTRSIFFQNGIKINIKK